MPKISKNTKSKYCGIRDLLKKKIDAGDYLPGSKLPTCRELAKTSGVSYVTASNAMRLLEQDGYIDRIQGSGIFVRETREVAVKKELKRVGFLIKTRGDLFQNFFSFVSEELIKEQTYSVPLTNSETMDKMSSDECKSYLEKFIADNFEAFVINGNRHFPFNLLKQLEKKIRQLIFVMHFNSDVEFFDANLITADYNECGYLAAKHLIERGKNRIALLTFEEIDELKRRRNGCSRNDYDFDILNGIEKAYKEASLDFYQHTALFHDPTEKDKSSLISQIKNFTEPGNTGVICVGDNRALSVYQAAQEIGIQIGKDLGVIGLYNTSWTRALFPALSSISINEEEIAKLTLQAITEGWKGKRIVIQPELIIRKST